MTHDTRRRNRRCLNRLHFFLTPVSFWHVVCHVNLGWIRLVLCRLLHAPFSLTLFCFKPESGVRVTEMIIYDVLHCVSFILLELGYTYSYLLCKVYPYVGLSVSCCMQPLVCGTVFQRASLLPLCLYLLLSAVVLNHTSSHFLISLSDSSLMCTVIAQWLVILDTIIVIITYNIMISVSWQ